MKKHSVSKRIISSLVAAVTAFSSLFTMALPSLAVNEILTEDKIIGGTDFAEVSDKIIGGTAGTTSLKRAESGEVYLEFEHQNKENFTFQSDGGDKYMSVTYASTVAASMAVPFTKKTDKSFTVELNARYTANGSKADTALVTFVGTNGSSVNVVKVSANGDILYRDGTGYKDTGIDLVPYQWRNIAVSITVNGTVMSADIYVTGQKKAENISFNASSEFTAVKTAEPLATGVNAKIDINDIFVYNSDIPLYGTQHGASDGDVSALFDFDSLEKGTLITDNYVSDKFSVYALGNAFSVEENGANKYFTATLSDGRPYATMHSVKPTIGRSQVLEISLKRDANWKNELTILSPYYEDSAGIRQYIDFIRVRSNGTIVSAIDGKLIGNVETEEFTVISVVISADRTYYDVYIDGRLELSNVKYEGKAFPRIDGIKVFGFEDSDSPSGIMYVDYAVMYNSIIPTYADPETKFVFEGNFDSAKASDIVPLQINGNGIDFVKNKNNTGYRLGYISGGSGDSSVSAEIPQSPLPFYVEYTFSYEKLTGDASLLTLSGENSSHIVAGITKDGKLFTMSGAEKRVGQILTAGKEYRLTVVADLLNSYFNVYIDGATAYTYNLLPADSASYNKAEFIAMNAGGLARLYADDMVIYRAGRKLGMPLENAKLDFDLKVGWTGAVTVSWEGVGPAAKYTVWKSLSADAPQNKICELTSKNSFVDTDVEEGKTYFYSVYLTFIREGEEQYIGFGETIKSIMIELPPDSEKPSTPPGVLPSFQASVTKDENFSDEKTSLKLSSERCYIEESSQTLKIVSSEEHTQIPYFSIENISKLKSEIYDFEFTVNKNEGKISLAAVYSESGKLSELAYIEDGKLYYEKEVLANVKDGSTYRVTFWVDSGFDKAAVFLDGECIKSEVIIPRNAGSGSGYFSVRFCQALGNVNLSVDNFKNFQTRVFITDYTANSLAVAATYSAGENNIYWAKVDGCKYYTLWGSDNEYGNYSLIADELTDRTYTEKDIKGNRFYKVTYTFDSLGLELTTPLSEVGISYYDPLSGGSGDNGGEGGSSAAVKPFIDFTNGATIGTLVIFAVGFIAIVASFVKIGKKPETEAQSVDNEK